MSNKSEKDFGLIRVREYLPYFGKGIDDLIAAIRKIFFDNKNPQKIILEAGSAFIYLEKLLSQEEANSAGLEQCSRSIYDGIRNITLEEYTKDEDISPFQQLFEIYSMIYNEGFEVCHIAIGNKINFQKWLGVRIPQNNMYIFGTKITVTGEIPEDVFVVCGGITKDSEPYEIKYAVKGVL